MNPTVPITPVPRDVMLPLPADGFLLQAAAVALFLAHIIFVAMMFGGAGLALACEIIGLRRPAFDRLARAMLPTVTVNKSLAVVLGVGPLLVVNVLYAVHFYSANALTGLAWIMIVPLVSLAFLLAYAWKYSWDSLAGRKVLHIALGAATVVLLAVVPLIFLSNINLMLFPQRWPEVRGWLSTLPLPNVLPRYAHFLVAGVLIGALFMLGYLTRAGFPLETVVPGFTRPQLRRGFYAVAFAAAFLQLGVGGLVLLTLPAVGLNAFMIGVILAGMAGVLAALGLMGWELIALDARIGRFYTPVVGLLMFTGCCMGYGRHLYRENALAEHRIQMAERTREHHWHAQAAAWRARRGEQLESENLPPGPRTYRDTCSACHARDHVLVGPPLTEIARLYRDNPLGIVAWTRAPVRKRPGFPAMPAFQLPADRLEAVARYMIEAGSAPAATSPGAGDKAAATATAPGRVSAGPGPASRPPGDS